MVIFRPRAARCGAALLLMVFIWAWGASRDTSAQLGSLFVKISHPAPGVTVSGTTAVRATVSTTGSLVVAGVQFTLDGVNLGAEDRTKPYAISWNTKGASNGSHTLRAVARDMLGMRWMSDPVTVTVFNDKTAPTVSIATPAGGAKLSATITVTATAADNVGVAGVQFRLDGAPLGVEDTSAPYTIAWDTRTAANGSHALSAIARDAAGNRATSGSVTVTVDNVPPDTTAPSVTITTPASGTTVSGLITVGADASDNVGVAGVRFQLDGVDLGAERATAPYAIGWDTNRAANGSHTLTAIARDAAGNVTTSGAVTVTVDNPVRDTTSPSVTMTAPSGGATVSGTITLSADASDNVAVAGVWFRVDGADLGPQDTTAPYALSWNTRSVTNGSHTLTAVARDASGNASTSAAVVITVSNTGTVTRIEETSSAIAYTGGWMQGNVDRPWSGGTAAVGSAAGHVAQLTFSGTAVNWIGFRGPQTGMARVLVDGTLRATVDAYAETETVGAVLFTVSGLASGTHVLRIETTGDRNPAATDGFVVVDAFDVTSSGGGPPPDTTPPSAAITSPPSGAIVSGTITVTADASDNVGVAGVRFRLDGADLGAEDTAPPYAAPWNTRTAVNGSHTLTAVARDAAGNTTTSASVTVTVDNPPTSTRTFQPGDVLVSLEQGNVLWFLPDGTPHAVLPPGVAGAGEGMAFDSAGNLYVSRWCNDASCSNGNIVEKFDSAGRSAGAVGSGYDCAPHTLVFDPADVAYVGEAGCRKAILKFRPGMTEPVAYTAAEEVQGIFWLDLAANRCTLFYTSYGPNVKRFDVCAGVQLADFNVGLMPGGSTQDLRVLPDGGLLVASGEVVARLDAAGTLVRSYAGPAAGSTYFVGLDLVGDGTFWVVNYFTSDVYRFDLATGAVVDSFNTGTPPNSAVAVRVKR